jgi:hypothetical protein
VYDWSKSLKECQTEDENVKTTPSAGKVMARIFWDCQGILLIDFLIEQ